MATLKTTNVLLLLIAALLGIHIVLQALRPVGSYEWVGKGGVLDTRTGVVYTNSVEADIPRHTMRHENTSEIPAPTKAP